MASLQDASSLLSTPEAAIGGNAEHTPADIIASFPSDDSTDIFLDFASNDGLPFGITTMKSVGPSSELENVSPANCHPASSPCP
jgi:hypothetical protein